MQSRHRNTVVVASLVLALMHPAGVVAQDGWIEVRSEHFAVVSNADEDDARRIAALLETIKQVYVNALPGVQPRVGPPLEVFAAKDRDTLRELLPRFAERDARNMPLGAYVRTGDKDFIVLLEDARTENPYETVFHEYFHSLATPVIPWAPPWFQEGIAEFWGHTIIKSDSVETGRPSELSMQILQQERWFPLEELVGANREEVAAMSPRRTGVFYAQSWFVLHYVLLGERTGQMRERITPYLQSMMNGRVSVPAFEAAFGAVEDVERDLRQYLRRTRFQALEIERPQGIDGDSYAVAVLPPDQLHARLGSYFVHGGDIEEGRAELDQALAQDPDNALAHESLGVLHYRAGEQEQARASFEKAASLNGTLHLPHFYLALLEPPMASLESVQRIQSRLERAVQMNPYHAPPLSRLSLMYVYEPAQVELSLTLARRAAGLSPTDPYALVAQGITAKANGQILEAKAALEAALRLAPSYQVAQEELAEVERIHQFPASGTWAFEDLQGWLQFAPDGKALRCVFTAGGLARYTGRLVGSEVTWSIPGADGAVTESTDSVAASGAEMRIDTGRDELVLRRVELLPDACESILK